MGLMRYLARRQLLIVLLLVVINAIIMILTNQHASGILSSCSEKSPGEQERSLKNAVLERIDWNDYNLMKRESTRTGLAEHGVGGKLNLSENEQLKAKELFDKYKYDVFLGDRISLERSIGDLRPDACKKVKYLKNIPENSVSIIIPMHNEKNSTLLRTIHSIINRSPVSLLREVIIVDDVSQDEELKAPLNDYIRQHFSNVKIIRNNRREGLIRSRIKGADFSSGSFLLFLDSHVEVNYNYLPPLLEIIMLDYRTIACPTVDFITYNFKIDTLAEKRARGGFNWNFHYKRMPVTTPMDDTTPHASPVMVGCAFAISRRWWEKLGKYDPGLDVWGGEQFELSFKTWQCGGSMIDSPCSRVAHLFRDWPYVSEVVKVINNNLQRVITVWADEFKEVVLLKSPYLRDASPGDIIQQIELRKNLKCKPFDWFLTEVAPDILELFPLVEPSPLAWGQLRSNLNSSLCVYTQDMKIYLDRCNREPANKLTFDWRLHIAAEDQRCFSSTGQEVAMWSYVDIQVKPIQSFAWDYKGGHIANFHSHLCIDFRQDTLQLYQSECDENKSTQSWSFEHLNETRVVEVWENYIKNSAAKMSR